MGAGDWIKMRCNLDEDPRVLAIADRLKMRDVDVVVGKLWRLWRYGDQHTVDGQIPFATAGTIDRMLGVKGMSAALEAVGWLSFCETAAVIPRFDEHNGETAKRRLKDAARKFTSRNSPLDPPERPPTADKCPQNLGHHADKERTHLGRGADQESESELSKKDTLSHKAGSTVDAPAESPEASEAEPDFTAHYVGGKPAPKPAAAPLLLLHPLPPDFEADESHVTIARDMTLDLAHEVAQFRDHYASAPRSSANWPAEFRKWLRRGRRMEDQRVATQRASPRRAMSSSDRNAENIRAFLAEAGITEGQT